MKQFRVRRGALASALALALVTPHVFAQQAQAGNDASGTQATPQDAKNAKNLEGVVVTGSRIPRAEIEGPAP
ncbi:hypothetical protein, partial [Dyella sp.]|uniref:hypothetical protein n=1 Tax=Dyella sp. TaxID=1869338 RepID=UPI002ED1D1AF